MRRQLTTNKGWEQAQIYGLLVNNWKLKKGAETIRVVARRCTHSKTSCLLAQQSKSSAPVWNPTVKLPFFWNAYMDDKIWKTTSNMNVLLQTKETASSKSKTWFSGLTRTYTKCTYQWCRARLQSDKNRHMPDLEAVCQKNGTSWSGESHLGADQRTCQEHSRALKDYGYNVTILPRRKQEASA